MSDPGLPAPKPLTPASPSTDPAPASRKWWFIVGVAALLLLVGAIAAIGSDDDGEPSAESLDATTTTPITSGAPTPSEPSDTTVSPSTTDAPTGTEAPTPPEVTDETVAVVWQSDVDPDRVNASVDRPVLEEGPLNARVDLIAVTAGPESSDFCAISVDEAFEPPEIVDSCLFIQWRLDVSDQATDTIQMYAIEAVSADGRQYEPLYTDFLDARPGTVDNVALAVYPNLGVGSRVFVTYSAEIDGEFTFGDWEVVVPDALQPVDWFDE